MDANIKRIWVKALRSGIFRQGKGRLHRCNNGKNYYCCLGVLQEAVIGTIGPRHMAGMLNSTEKRIAKLKERECRLLTDMNDGMYVHSNHFSFNEIADWIDQHL